MFLRGFPICRKKSWAKLAFNWKHLGEPQEKARQALKAFGRSRSWFLRARHIYTLGSSVQHMVRRKNLQVGLCDQLMHHSTGEVVPPIHLSALPKENQNRKQ